MNKIIFWILIGTAFVVSSLVSKDIMVTYRGDMSQLIGLGAVVVGYFIGKTLLKVLATAK